MATVEGIGQEIVGIGCGEVLLGRISGRGQSLRSQKKILVNGEETAEAVQRTAGADSSKRREEINDLACVKKVLGGDVGAFREIVERYERRAYAIALSVLGNQEDARDVAQEAFVKIYQKLDSFKGESGFYTWLYRIVFNLAVDLSRRRYRTREIGFVEEGSNDRGIRAEEVSESEFSGHIETPVAISERAELGKEIDRAMQSLSPEHRAVIMLREVDGLSYTEIAQSVGISKGTVMSRLHHARRKLQMVLRKFRGSESEDLKGPSSLTDLTAEEV